MKYVKTVSANKTKTFVTNARIPLFEMSVFQYDSPQSLRSLNGKKSPENFDVEHPHYTIHWQLHTCIQAMARKQGQHAVSVVAAVLLKRRN